MRSFLMLLMLTVSISAIGQGFWKPYERAPGGIFFQDRFNRASLDGDWTLDSAEGFTVVSNDVLRCSGAFVSNRFMYYNPMWTACEQWRATWKQMYLETNVTSIGTFFGIRNRPAGIKNYYFGMSGATGSDMGEATVYLWSGSALSIPAQASSANKVTVFKNVWLDYVLLRSNDVFTISITNPANGSWSSTSLALSYTGSGSVGPSISSWAIMSISDTNLIEDLTVTLARRIPIALSIQGKSIDEGWTGGTYAARYFTKLQTNLPSVWPIANDSAPSNMTSNYVQQLTDLDRLRPARVWFAGPTDIIQGVTSNVYWSNITVCADYINARGGRAWASIMTPNNTSDYRSWNWGATNFFPGGPDPGWDVLVTNSFNIKPEFAIADLVHLNDLGMTVAATNYYNWWRR